MKRLLPFAPLLLLAALLLSPAAALAGARQGLEIWLGRVFPALLPTFLCVRTAQNLGLLRLADRRPKARLALVFGFSLASGAPNGAKLLGAMANDGAVSHETAEGLLPLGNAVSPAFLLSIIASELLKNKALFLPLAAAFYGPILCLAAGGLLRRGGCGPAVPSGAKAMSFAQALSAAIESSMLDMLRIGGCILPVCTALSLLRPLVPGEVAYAGLAGLMEVSVGAAALSQLGLPLRTKLSLLAGFAAFGGLSLALQTLCCWPGLRLLRYLLRKALLGLLTGLLCYLLFPLFPGVAAAFASRQEVLTRSLSLSALLLSSALSVGFIGVLALMVSGRKGPSS